MNILFLTHPYPNFVPDLLLHGLRQTIGSSVVDFPKKETLYRGILLGVESDNQGIRGWDMTDDPDIDRDDIEHKIAAGYFNYTICDMRALTTYPRLVARCRNIAFIDGEDMPAKVPLGRHIIFRRETDGTDMSIPLPMGLPFEIYQWISSYDSLHKKYSICFIGSYTQYCMERLEIAEYVSKHYPDSYVTVSEVATKQNRMPPGRVSRQQYYELMQQSKIVLSIRGAGWDTFRFWENCACNAVHLSQKMPILIPNDFIENEDIFRFDNIDELKRIIDKTLSVDFDHYAFVQRMRQKLLNAHLTIHRANYVIDKLRRYYN